MRKTNSCMPNAAFKILQQYMDCRDSGHNLTLYCLPPPGMAWLLRRVDPATQLRISMINAPVADDSHDDTEDWESLMSDLHAVIKASQHLPHMKALVCCSASQSLDGL